MPTSYPGALDAFTNPTDVDTLDSPPHDDQHTDNNDATVAIETELGINPRGSFATVRARLDHLDPGGGWQAWTPTLTNITLGDGVLIARYIQLGKTVVGRIHFEMGSTSTMGTNPRFSAPVTVSSIGYATIFDAIGNVSINDAGTAQYVGGVRFVSGDISPFVFGADSTFATLDSITSTVPMTWTTGDNMMLSFAYEAA